MPSKTQTRTAMVLLIAMAIFQAGCQYTGWAAPPGPMGQQQARAAIHDPFPLNDLGPVDAGMRPPGYEQPLPEAVRDRIGPDSMPWLGQ